MIDTGVWRNIGERLFAVRAHVEGEEMFLANYSDGLSDVDLPAMIEAFRKAGRLPVSSPYDRPSASISLIWTKMAGSAACVPPRTPISGSTAASSSSALQIFDYLRDGEELVETPFRRLIDADQLLAFKHEGFWRPMDTLKDKEVLEDMVEQGRMPWRLAETVPAVSARPWP